MIRIPAALEEMHQQTHFVLSELERDPEDTLLVAFERHEIVLATLGLACASWLFPCLEEQGIVPFLLRLQELIDAQGFSAQAEESDGV